MTADPQEIATAVAAAMYGRDHAAQALGITVDAVRPGYARARMTVRDDMVNGHAVCHGGLTFALADTAFAYACNAANVATLAQHCSIAFTAPARAGDVLTATAEERLVRGRTGIYDVTVVDQNDATIALFRGHGSRTRDAVVDGLPQAEPAS